MCTTECNTMNIIWSEYTHTSGHKYVCNSGADYDQVLLHGMLTHESHKLDNRNSL